MYPAGPPGHARNLPGAFQPAAPAADDESVREQMNGDQADAMENLAPADWATADEIRRRRFTKVSDGYSPDEVHDYLGHLAGTFATLRSQIGELRKSTAPLVHQGPEGMSDLASRMAGVLRESEEHATRARQEAEQEPTGLVAEGRQEADRVLAEAREEADRTVVAARKEAEQAIASHVEAARLSAERADKALAGAAEQSAMLLATAHEEAARIRAGAEQEAVAAREEAEPRSAEALAFRDTMVAELRSTMERVTAAAPVWPGVETAEATQAATGASMPPAPEQMRTGSTPNAEDAEPDL